MRKEKRNRLIDNYFEAMDENDFSIVETAASDDIQFKSPGGTVSGIDEFREYAEKSRIFTDSDHNIVTRVHGEDRSVCEGTVSGETPDGPVEGEFCDVFEFDGEDDQITNISVYTRM